jgi:bile acid:Na+ symporter, BASS family
MVQNIFSNIMMPIAIGLIMFGIGTDLRFKDFTNIFLRPKAVIIGLIAQMVLLPIIAFIINYFLNVSPIVKVGFILIAACPGGTTSNLVTLILRGRLALSVTLTAFNSFLILFTIPAILNLALQIYEGHGEDIELPFSATVFDIFLTVLLPTLLGMLLREYRPLWVKVIKKPVNILMVVFLLLAFVGIILVETQGSGDLLRHSNVFLPSFLLNLIGMAVGYLLALVAGINNRGRFTIAIQVGLQNSALAIYVASKLLGQNEMAIVAVVYGSFTLFTTALWAFLMKRFL